MESVKVPSTVAYVPVMADSLPEERETVSVCVVWEGSPLMTGRVGVHDWDWKGFWRTQGPSWPDPVSEQLLWVILHSVSARSTEMPWT